jgi:hypothetical protein
VSAGESGIRLQLLAPARAPEGEPVRYTLHIENAGDRPATLYLQGRPPAFDLVVLDDAGRMIWRRLGGATILTVLGIRELRPGQTIDFTDVWSLRDQADQPLAPGRYRLTGIVPGEPGQELRSADVALDIVSS